MRANGIWIACPCGKEFYVRPSETAKGKKYCSQPCYNRFTIRPRGEAKPGSWKGDDVGYQGLHDWIRRERGAPVRCEWCGKTEGRIEWANLSHEYRRDLDDWLALCKPCHWKHDSPTCRRGHERTAENTWVDNRGYPHCRPCRNERLKMERAGKRAEWDEKRLLDSSDIRKKYGAPAGV